MTSHSTKLNVIGFVCMTLFSGMMMKSAHAVEKLPIHFSKAIFAQNRNEINEERGVFVLDKHILPIDPPRPTLKDLIKSGNVPLFGVTRYDAFVILNEKKIEHGNVNHYLLSNYLNPCRPRSISAITVANIVNGELNSKINGSWIKGCATDARNYSSLVVVGSEIKEVLRIKPAIIEPAAPTYQPIGIAPGSPQSLIDNVNRMNAALEKQFKEKQAAAPEPKKVSIDPSNPVIDTRDPRIKPFIEAASMNAKLKNHKPVYFVSSGNRQFALFVPISSASGSGPALLTEINNNYLQIVEESDF